MKKYEKDEISRLDPKYRPLGAWRYFGLTILYSIPFIGFIFLIVFACNDSNINRRSHARSYFCAFLIILIPIAFMAILVAILSAVGASTGILAPYIESLSSLFDTIKETLMNLIQGAGA